MTCAKNGSFRWFYTGNQVGYLNHTGCFNFVAGGPPGSGISAGTLVARFFQDGWNRALWQGLNACLTQELLDACWPFIELQWIAEISIADGVEFRVSNRNIYVEDRNNVPRFYEARVDKGPPLNVTAGEWLSPNFEIGDLTIVLNNRDGFFNEYLPQGENYTQWIGGEVKILVGFGEKRKNYFEIFNGIIPHKKGVSTSLEDIRVSAYDKFEEDRIEIPTLVFDRTNFPFVDTDKVGKVLPLIYGDWTEDLSSEFGDVTAICSNAGDDPILSYVWNISENALREIGDVYLHRGDRNDNGNGPIRLLDSAIVKEPERGRIQIPAGVTVLEEVYVLIDNGKPGTTGAVGEILAESSKQNFVALGVNDGDTIFKEGDTTPYEVIGVSTGTLQTTIPTVMTSDNNYKILTDKYVFKSGDKLSIICKGKDIEVMGTTRVTDALNLDVDPQILSIGLENDFWTVDNVAQKVYNVSFANELINEYSFSDISPEITEITGLDVQTDGTLWLVDRPLSKIYRFVIEDEALGLSFSTLQVDGLVQFLDKAGPLSIDDGNVITLHEQVSGNFYRINPFAGVEPGLMTTWNRNDFEPLALDIVDIAADVNANQIVCMDRATGKVYRVEEGNGAFVESFELTEVADNFIQGRGVGYYIDGTLFLLNKQDLTIYNYNEFDGANENPGFIARDILQSFAGKSTFDFDLKWNETCRGTLSDLKARVVIDEETNTLDFLTQFMQSFNTSVYLSFQKYSLFFISFENFTTEGLPIREGDIKLGSFNPSKEYNQYFNTAFCNYKNRPFTGRTIQSDNYVSPSGVQLAGGKEIKKGLNLEPVYRREDLDVLMPLFVRLAAAEPEFVNLNVGFRFLFAQLNTFYNINFKDLFNKNEKSGRRFDNIPSFVRKIQINLDSMDISLKLWSLGTTQFGDFVPAGFISGGQFDQIILTNLGTAGYVAPVGDILSSPGANQLQLEDRDGQTAEDRSKAVVGKAWVGGYKVGLYSGEDHSLVEELEIDQVTGQIVTMKADIVETVQPTVRNSAGFIVGGHYLKYLDFNKLKQAQQTFYASYCKPIEGYPLTTTEEIEEQKSGKHSFDNGRLPYVLHPVAFVPN